VTTVALIAAVARNGVIGKGGVLAWRHPLDAAHFRRTTMGCPVIMGRKTWESLPERFRPLPGRRNVVVTRDPAFEASGAEIAHSLDAALDHLAGQPRIFVIGGGQLYAEALPRADELVLTEIDEDIDGDVRFPGWPRADFDEAAREAHPGFAFVTYRRRGAKIAP
jgi:dihydrofolate reductase